MKRVAILSLFLLGALPVAVLGQDPAVTAPAEAGTHTFTANDAVSFAPFGVPGFDPGIQLAVIHGDPMAESGDYTLRLVLPDGYRFPAHYHPMAEHLTVLSGTFLIASGTDENPDALEEYTPGAFLYFPPEQPHYGGATGQTVVQLHGQAPFKIVLANAGT